jgi:hypothetical protein
MRYALRPMALVAVVSIAVVGTSATAGAKDVSTAKYAKVVCGTYSDIQDEVEAFKEAYNALPSDDAAGFQTQAVALTNTLLDDVGTLKAKLQKVSPSVDDGKKITKLFAKNLNEFDSEVTKALETFQAADANAAAFTADIAGFEAAVTVVLDAKTSDPFSKVKDQDVIGAFGDEKSCKAVVTAIGG